MKLLRLTFLFICLFFAKHSKAQMLFGILTDENGNALAKARVTNATMDSRFELTDEKGSFKLNIIPGDSIHISWQKFSKSYLPSTNQTNDTLFQVFVLPVSTQLDQVVIDAKRYPKVGGENDETVIDYIAAPDGTLYLIKIRRKDYLISRRINDSWHERVLNFHPEKLFLDCFENVHLLTKDSAYQVNPYSIIPEFAFGTTRSLFDQEIAPCVATGKNGLFEQALGRHNQLYKMRYKRSDSTAQSVVVVYDKIGAKVAQQDYNAVVARYLASSDPDLDNMITTGVWDGDVMTLGGTHFDADIVVWYKYISAKPVNVASFGQGDQVVTVDLFSDSVYVFSLDGSFRSSQAIRVKENENADIKFDQLKKQCYFIKPSNRTRILYEINEQNGAVDQVCDFKGVSFASNIQISGGVIYFLLKNYQGMTHLYRFAKEY